MRKKNLSKWGGALIIILLLAAFIASSRSNSSPKNNENIKIGFVSPQSGDAASYGEYVTKAFKLAIDDFNAESKDVHFDVVYEDGKGKGLDAANAINKLINIDGTKYVIGGLASSETLSMAPIAEQNQVILFTPGSGSPEISKAGDYIFRNLASDDYTAKEIAKLAIQNGDDSIGIISENIDYPQTLRSAFKNYYADRGGRVDLDETFESGATDFRTIITKAKQKNLKSIYIVVQSYKSSALMLKQMQELKFAPKIYATESTISSEALANYDAGSEALLEGAIFTQPKFDESNARTAKVLEKFTQKYGSTEGPIPPVYIATYYDSVYLLGEAIRHSGNNPTRVKDYFYGIKNWPGAVGNFSFDSNGDAVTDVEAKTVKDAKIVSYPAK